MNAKTVIFIGKPGSGKGTQATLLAKKTQWPVIVSGDLFRALAKEDSFVGRKTRWENEQGLLGPDWFATYFFQKSILDFPVDKSVIFDGFGRKVPEAQTVISVLTWLERHFTAIHINVSDEEVITRLTKRGSVSGRADDTKITKRLEEYRTFTEPAIEVFRSAGVLVEVDGEKTEDEIHADISNILDIK